MPPRGFIICWTLKEKLELIEEFEKSGMSKTAFSKLRGIPRTTLVGILSAKESILSSTIKSTNRKRLRRSNFNEVEISLVKWIKHARTNNILISGNVLREKALEIASELGESFAASSGWMDRFKERHSISLKEINGKPSSVNPLASHWNNFSLQDILKRYSESDIFNLDETGLFFRLQPNKVLNFSSEKCAGNIVSKVRLTVLLGANMNGTEKLKPIVIGRSSKLACFKTIKFLPVTYETNYKAWITSSIWEKTIQSLDKKFLSDNRKVIFIVDKCPAHTIITDLKAIEIVFLPQSIASGQQPLNQGVIQDFKLKYRKCIVRDMVKALDSNKKFDVSVLDAIHYINKSWNEISVTTIQNSFMNAGFGLQKNDTVEAVNKEMCELGSLFADLSNRGVSIPINEQVYVDIDVNIQVSAEATITDIVSEVLDEKESLLIDSDNDSEDESELHKPLTKHQALESLDNLRRYIMTVNGISDKDNELLNNLEKKISLNE